MDEDSVIHWETVIRTKWFVLVFVIKIYQVIEIYNIQAKLSPLRLFLSSSKFCLFPNATTLEHFVKHKWQHYRENFFDVNVNETARRKIECTLEVSFFFRHSYNNSHRNETRHGKSLLKRVFVSPQLSHLTIENGWEKWVRALCVCAECMMERKIWFR